MVCACWRLVWTHKNCHLSLVTFTTLYVKQKQSTVRFLYTTLSSTTLDRLTGMYLPNVRTMWYSSHTQSVHHSWPHTTYSLQTAQTVSYKPLLISVHPHKNNAAGSEDVAIFCVQVSTITSLKTRQVTSYVRVSIRHRRAPFSPTTAGLAITKLIVSLFLK